MQKDLRPDTGLPPLRGLRLTPHAARRQQQRGLGLQALDAALRWGRPVRQAGGRTAFHLGRRGVLAARAAGEVVHAYANVTVVVGPDGGVVTVFRSGKTRRLRRAARRGEGGSR